MDTREHLAKGSNVAVFLQPSADWIACLLAVMCYGGIYTPLDSSQGITRLQQIITASTSAVILVDSTTEHEAAD